MKKIMGMVLAGVFFSSCLSDGKDGISPTASLVELKDEIAGENCSEGGVRISSGMDTNNDGILDD
ncbi:MAG: hypothetical protein JXR90_15890, partial [Spirochaetes bacterium]|nr:hypothetical protein [Spirochaetota bacterium]